PELTSPFKFYQFWLNTDDRDVIQYLKFFTLLDQAQISELEAELASDPGRRGAQKRLAAEVTATVHGADQLSRAERASGVLFGGSLEGLSAVDVAEIFADVPSSQIDRGLLEAEDLDIVTLLVQAGAAASKGEARRLIKGGGVYLNSERVEDWDRVVSSEDAIEGRYLVVRVGKRRYHLVEVG
ncbi:MAG: S4 domain-containing protein, partial [Longimicrobiales bacterium]